jgi:hypothetical protein
MRRRINLLALIAPSIYLLLMATLCLMAETDLKGGEQFIPVGILGLPWTLLLAPLGIVLGWLPEGPIFTRLLLFLYFVVLCGGANSFLLYKAVRMIQRRMSSSGEPPSITL